MPGWCLVETKRFELSTSRMRTERSPSWATPPNIINPTSMWWRRSDSNRLPLQCHCSALPGELRPHWLRKKYFRIFWYKCQVFFSSLAKNFALHPKQKSRSAPLNLNFHSILKRCASSVHLYSIFYPLLLWPFRFPVYAFPFRLNPSFGFVIIHPLENRFPFRWFLKFISFNLQTSNTFYENHW